MKPIHLNCKSFCVAAGAGLLLLVSTSRIMAQQPGRSPKEEDVVRVSTTLVQTDAMVFDKQGKFVEGLKPEEFILKLNGKPIPISFLELVTAGSAEEKSQIESVQRGQTGGVSKERPTPTAAAAAGRSIFIFVDDFHLEGESFQRTRKALLSTVDKEIAPSDRALVTAASGQLGPQSLTTDKAALKAVIDRLALRSGSRKSIENPPMSEYAAVAINHGDTATMSYFIDQILKENPLNIREIAEQQVKNRAQNIVAQAEPLASNTLTALEGLIRDLTPLPGRKLVFFLSDGFLIEDQSTNSYTRFRSLTQLAARAGVVIYSFNARGLVTTGPDASDGGSFNPRLVRAAFSADSAQQDVLHSLAAETGGRALVNNNDINSGVRRALEETSRYYLLAWRPLPEFAAGEKVKLIELAIAGRSELTVKTRRELAEAVSQTLVATTLLPTAGRASPAPSSELLTALNSAAPLRGIPASLVLVYRNLSTSLFAVTASLQLPTSSLSFADVNGKQTATVEVAGTVLDQAGKQVKTFTKSIDIAADSAIIEPSRKLIFYNYDVELPAGNYRVRLGIRDSKNQLMGGASSSIEIPEIASGKLSLSSLLLNEKTDTDEEEPAAVREELKGLTQHFAQGAHLRFLTFIHNAEPVAANDNEPDIDVVVKILRGNQQVLVPDLRELLIDDRANKKIYPFAGEIPLEGLPAGEYVLQLTVTDLTTKASATQQTTIIVE